MRKKIKIVALFMLVMMVTFQGCDNSKKVTKEVVKENNIAKESSAPAKIEESNTKFHKLLIKSSSKLNNYNIMGKVDDNNFIVYTAQDNTSIGLFDIKNNSVKIIQKPKVNGNHFFDIAYDDGWLVWSENKDAVIGTDEAKGFNWLVVAKNLSTGEERIIDKAKYTESEFNVPTTYYYCPIYLSNKSGTVVYRASDKRESDGKLINKIVTYNIENDKLSTLATSEEMDKECFLLPSTDGNKIMWLDLKEKNTSGRFFYNHNDISYYDIRTQKCGKLNLPFKNMVEKFVFDQSDVYISMAKNEGNSTADLRDRLVKYNLNDKSVVDILPEDDDTCASLKIASTGLIAWENHNQYNYRMYDIKNNKRINLVDKENLKQYSHISYDISGGILRILYDKDGQQSLEYYDLSKKAD